MPGAGGSITLDLSEFAAWAQTMGRDLQSVDYTPALKQCSLALVSATKANFDGQHSPDGSPWRPLRGSRPRGGDRILRDRGLLMGSITGRGQGHIEELTSASLIFGTNLSYAATHQYGATIRPVRAKMLAMPLTPAAFRAGSPRQFGRDLFVWRSGPGNLFLAESKGKRAKLVLHYRLLPSVTIPARPFLGVSVQMAEDVGNIFQQFLVKVLGKRTA